MEERGRGADRLPPLRARRRRRGGRRGVDPGARRARRRPLARRAGARGLQAARRARSPAYAEDVRAGRPVIGRLMPTATLRRDRDALRGARLRPAAAAVLARRLQRDGRELDERSASTRGSSLLEHLARALHLHRVRQARVGPLGRPGRARSRWGDYAAQGAACSTTSGSSARTCSGGCIGCSIALAVRRRVAGARRADGALLAGGRPALPHDAARPLRRAPRLRRRSTGSTAVVDARARASEQTFAQDPRVGPVGRPCSARPGVRRASTRDATRRATATSSRDRQRSSSTATPSPGPRARGAAGARAPRAGRPRAATPRTRPRPRATSRSACRLRVLGRTAARADRGRPRRARRARSS